jgi:hypothetical protein
MHPVITDVPHAGRARVSAVADEFPDSRIGPAYSAPVQCAAYNAAGSLNRREDD